MARKRIRPPASWNLTWPARIGNDVSNTRADLTGLWFYTSVPLCVLCVLFCSPLSTTFQNTRQTLSWRRASTCPCLPGWTRQGRGPFISTAACEPPPPPLAASFPLPFPLAPLVPFCWRHRLGDSTGCQGMWMQPTFSRLRRVGTGLEENSPCGFYMRLRSAAWAPGRWRVLRLAACP